MRLAKVKKMIVYMVLAEVEKTGRTVKSDNFYITQFRNNLHTFTW